MKVKVTPRVAEWLEGTGVGQALSHIQLHQLTDEVMREALSDPEDEWNVATLILKVRQAPTRADGSCYPDLTRDEIQELYEYSDFFAHASSDPASDSSATGDMGGLADLNAARAQMRRASIALEAIRRTPTYG